MDFGYELNKVAYSYCRECDFYKAIINKDGTGGNICFFCRDDGNYIPFSTVNSKTELKREIEDYKENCLPDKCPYYSQACVAVFAGDDEAEELAEQEWNDYSKIVVKKISEINFDSSLFDYVKSVDPNFKNWADEYINNDCYCIFDGDDIIAFMSLDLEGDEKDYSWIIPEPKYPLFAKGRRRIRISNMLCNSEKALFGKNGLIKMAFLKALELKCDEIYAVSYENCGVNGILARNGFKGGFWNASNGDSDDAAQTVMVFRLDDVEWIDGQVR